jgi:kynurenine 3-monooxygenase
MQQPNKKLAVIGAGPVGYTTAMLMAKQGYDVDLYEKRKDPIGKDQALEWRSLNIFLNDKVVKAWKKLEVLEEIREEAKTLQCLQYHLDKGDSVKYRFSGPN